MNVQHTGPEPVYLPAVSDWVKPRQMVEVTEEEGQSLVEQGWTSARSKAAKKVARKRAANPVPVKEQQIEPNEPTSEED